MYKYNVRLTFAGATVTADTSGNVFEGGAVRSASVLAHYPGGLEKEEIL
jgi:hypothetical protein